MTKPGLLNSILANWAILLSQHDMTFVPQKAIKTAPAHFLVAHPIPETLKLHEDIPDEVIKANMTLEDEVLQIFFDGTSKMGPEGKIVTGVGVVFVSLNNHVLPHAFSSTKPCSNNVIEYNALLIGLQLD